MINKKIKVEQEMIDDNTLGILYESSRADLVFQTIQLKEFGL